MIVNLLRFRFRDDVTEAERDTVLEAMRRTAGVESAAFGTVGRDLGDPADGFTHAYCVGVPDLAALERYLHDPVHLAGDDVILPSLARLSAVRFTDDADPDTGAKMGALVLAKLAKYPAWEQQLNAIPG
ncbi:Dabb family protein [Amycolatopsis solani]|uniref:Dabb family protein n=1 Tax=Amycolatopsis solani TaxID=3028615 RepID=UPI0025AFD12D|nr:Dabb family protein [Amycolatopsis sp. MEP2-6]